MELIYFFRKSFLSIVLMSFFLNTMLIAQGTSKKYLLTDFKQASTVIPFNERFQFENFKKGIVYKQTGKRSEANLNYSYLYGDILFIGPSHDTLSISDAELVKNVSIGGNIYFYDLKYGFVEISAEYDGVKVGKKSQLALIDYDNRPNFVRMDGATSRPGQGTIVKMPGNIKIDNLTHLKLEFQLVHFFIDKNNRFHIAERDSLLKIYGRAKKKVIAYLNTHDVDYNNESDLKKAIEDCARLVELP